jgi:septum site-determining protein MinC
MDSLVTIKSNAQAIILKLDTKAPIEDILREICHKFATSKKFFGKANIVLQIDDRSLSDEELVAVVQSVEFNSDLKVSLVRTNNKNKGRKYLEMLTEDKESYLNNNFKIIYGPMIEKDIMSDVSMVVLGDVNENVNITSAGNIIVFGDLKGYASAGSPDRNNCYIVANSISAKKLSIGTHECDLPKQKKHLFSKKTTGTVVIFEKDRFIMNDFGNIDLYKHITRRKAK